MTFLCTCHVNAASILFLSFRFYFLFVSPIFSRYVTLAKTNRRARPRSEVLVKQSSLTQPIHGATTLVNAGGRYSGELATIPLQESPLQSLSESYGGPGSYPSAGQILYPNSDRQGRSFIVQQPPLSLTGVTMPGMGLGQSDYLATVGYPSYQTAPRSLEGSQEMLYDPVLVAGGQDQSEFPYQHQRQALLSGGKCRKGRKWVWSC